MLPVTTVTLGWPAETPDQVDRLPLEAVVHNEITVIIPLRVLNQIYKAKEVRSDSRQFVSENNKETLAQVFTDVRYIKADNIHFSKILLQVLKDQGFMEM